MSFVWINILPMGVRSKDQGLCHILVIDRSGNIDSATVLTMVR
jgi:hypothetical protein